MSAPKKKLLRILIIIIALLAIIVAFAPWIAISLFGKSILERQLRDQITAQVEIGSLSGGWSGAKLDYLRISQPPGFESVSQPLTEIRGIDIKTSLLSAVFGNISADIQIDQINAAVARAANGITNLQKLAKPKVEPVKKGVSQPAGEKKEPPAFKLNFKLANGSVAVFDLETGAAATIDHLTIDANRAEANAPIRVQAACSVKGGSADGKLNIRANYSLDTNAADAEAFADRIDLAAFSPFLAATKIINKTSGLLDGNIKIQYEKNGSVSGDGKLVITDLRMEGAKLKNAVREPRAELIPKFSYSTVTNILTMDGFELNSTPVSLSGRGSIDPKRGGTISLAINADLSKTQETFAAFFPSDAKIEGKVLGNLQLTANPGGESIFTIRLEPKGVSAAGIGDAASVPTDGLLTIQGSASADFSEITISDGVLNLDPIAHGTLKGKWKRAPASPPGQEPQRVPGNIDADMKFSLSLAKTAGRFRALFPKNLQIDGAVECVSTIKTNETQEMQFAMDLNANNLRASAAGPRPPSETAPAAWMIALESNPVVEDKLNISASGSVDRRFDRFEITKSQIVTSSGALTFAATASGGMWNIASSLKAKVHAEASLQKLSPYIAAFGPPRLKLEGVVVADLDLSAENGYVKGPVGIVAKKIVVSARPRGTGEEKPMDESLDRIVNDPVRLDELKLSGDVAMNRAENQLQVPNLTITTAPNVIQLSGSVSSIVDASSAGGSSSFDGEVAADLEPLLKLAGAFIPAGTSASGNLIMKGRVAREAAGTRWNIAGKVTNFTAQTAGFAPLPAEKELAIALAGSFEPAADGFHCKVDKTSISTQSGRVRFDMSGNVTKTKDSFSGTGSGTWSADVAFLAAIAPKALPPGASAAGLLAGDLSLTTSGDILRFATNSSITNFSFTPPEGAGPAVTDPKISVGFAAVYNNSTDELTTEKANISTSDRWIETKIQNVVISGLRGGRGITTQGTGAFRADVTKLAALAPGALPAGASVNGTLISNITVTNTGALTKFATNTFIEQFVLRNNSNVPDTAPSEFRDAKISLDISGNVDTARSELTFDIAQLNTANSGISADTKNISIKALTTERRLDGEIVISADGAPLTAAAAPWLPKKLTFDGKGNIGIRLGGSLGAVPLNSMKLNGDFSFPSIRYDDLDIHKGRGTWTLQDGLFKSDSIQCDFVQNSGAAPKQGQLTANLQIKVDSPERPFVTSFRAQAVPARKSLAAPLSYIFPLFSGEFKFATFDGSADGEGNFKGDATNWKSTTTGTLTVELKQVNLVGSDEFGQILSLLRINPLAKSFDSVRQISKIENGKIIIERIEVDGDASRLPLVGSVTFDGAMSVGVDLSRAKLGKKTEPFRPIIELFTPTFGGTVSSPKFSIAKPSGDKLLKAATKLAANQFLGGPKIDISKLSRVTSLREIADMAADDAPANPQLPNPTNPQPTNPPPNIPQPTNPNPTNPPVQPPPVLDAPANPGGMPVALGRSFRALAKGKTKFQYSALNTNPQLAESLRQWLAAAPPPSHVKTTEARIADLLNRYEVALALAVVHEIKNPLFAISNGKKGVHGIANFFEQTIQVAGAATSFPALKEELKKLAGEIVIFSIPGAAEDLPWIDRVGVDSKNVKQSIEDRAAAYLARVQLTQKGLIAVQPYVFRNFKNDEDKIREILRKYLPENNAARGKLDTAKLTKFPESLELDEP
ncbi:MAG: DUF748 domain-containing protein [Planctomycetota bacterium]